MLNKVILIGRLGKDPETRQTNQGAMRCIITVATDDTWKDKVTGEKQSKAEWHRVVFYNRLAEIASQYLRKGALVYVEGKITSYPYTGQDGIERKAYEILANEMKMLSPKPQHPEPYASPTYTGQGYGQPYAPQPYPQAPYAPPFTNPGNYSNAYPNEVAADLSPRAQSMPQNMPKPAPSAPQSAPNAADNLIEDDVPF